MNQSSQSSYTSLLSDSNLQQFQFSENDVLDNYWNIKEVLVCPSTPRLKPMKYPPISIPYLQLPPSLIKDEDELNFNEETDCSDLEELLI